MYVLPKVLSNQLDNTMSFLLLNKLFKHTDDSLFITVICCQKLFSYPATKTLANQTGASVLAKTNFWCRYSKLNIVFEYCAISPILDHIHHTKANKQLLWAHCPFTVTTLFVRPCNCSKQTELKFVILLRVPQIQGSKLAFGTRNN